MTELQRMQKKSQQKIAATKQLINSNYNKIDSGLRRLENTKPPKIGDR